jgi:predicted TIM-barrel fold metal-dependent hydrolase
VDQYHVHPGLVDMESLDQRFRLMFASDYPFDPEPGQFIRDTIAIIDSLDISGEDRAKIYHGNAERLLGLA